MSQLKPITCPETAHLERIEYDDSSTGFRVLACSRFAPGEPFSCTRLCVTRMNQRAGRASVARDVLVPLVARGRR
ncbi:MAG TPA: hypothetical protein VFP84_35295 [Kofleriaceae bacterium]|nr:hypothetical protein [Kofleriaceae bacterium]